MNQLTGKPQTSQPLTRPTTSRPLHPALSVAIAFVVGVVIWRGVDMVVDAVLPGYSTASHAARAFGCGALTMLAVAGYLRWTGQGWAALGWDRRRAPRELAVGMLAYLLPASLAITALVAFGPASIDVVGDPVAIVGQLLFLAVLVAAFEAVPEEFLVRGWVFGALAQRWRTGIAILGQAAFFCLWGLAIGAAPTVDRLIFFALFAIVQGVLRAQTGSVACTIGFHLAFQIVAQFLINVRWDAATLHDPGEWVTLIGIGLVPLAVAPLLARRLLRR